MISVVPYDSTWPEEFAREALRLHGAFGGVQISLEHIGSTSVPDLMAKPVIDILAVLPNVSTLDDRRATFERLGYEVMGEFGIAGRRYFRRDDENGRRTHQIHAFSHGSPEIGRHLDFRDYLRAHPRVREEYASLKRALAARCIDDMRCYSEGKTEFIRDVERRAAAWRLTARRS